MSRVNACLRTLLLVFVIAAPIVSMGCAARVSVYDPYRNDYHRWDGREQRAYRQYWEERHRKYRKYGRLNDGEKREYWDWRHHHPDSDRH